MEKFLTVIVISGTILSFMHISWWVAVIVFLLGSAVIGWEDRHNGPLPTNKNKE
jgi:uncharacterized membrane protein